MFARIGLKRIRRSLMRLSTKGYIRLITAFVIAGIFISEGSVKDISYSQNAKLVSKMVSLKHDNELQLSSAPEKTNKTESELRNGNSTLSSAKVSRTLNEILQEAIPEQIFGLSNKERNVSDESQLINSSSLLEDAAFGKAALNDVAVTKQRDAREPNVVYSNYSRTLVPARTRSQASPNETDFAKNSTQIASKAHSPFKGVLPTEDTAHLFKTDNVTHLSFMLYRLIKTHNIKSVLDVPCKLSVHWMGDLLQVLEFEVPKFHYRCLTPNDRSLAEGVVRFEHLSSATVLKNEHPWASRLPSADLALCWYGLGFLPPDRSWGLLKALRTAGVKYVLVPNYPEVRHNPGAGSALGRINVRRVPYRFSEPLRVVNNISTQASTPKQMLFYDLEGIRGDAI